MRGTNPSLTQTLINGHNVASGDWFVLEPGAAGRSQRELHAAAVRAGRPGHRAQELAGLARRRRRRGLGRHHHAQAARLHGTDDVRRDRSAPSTPSCRTRPTRRFSALFNWKNDAGTFGVMVQAFSEKRHLRRDGVEILGYRHHRARQRHRDVSNPDLSGVAYPSLIGAALVRAGAQAHGRPDRHRVQADRRPEARPAVLQVGLEATNYNRNYLLWGTNVVNDGSGPGAGPGLRRPKQHARRRRLLPGVRLRGRSRRRRHPGLPFVRSL